MYFWLHNFFLTRGYKIFILKKKEFCQSPICGLLSNISRRWVEDTLIGLISTFLSDYNILPDFQDQQFQYQSQKRKGISAIFSDSVSVLKKTAQTIEVVVC